MSGGASFGAASATARASSAHCIGSCVRFRANTMAPPRSPRASAARNVAVSAAPSNPPTTSCPHVRRIARPRGYMLALTDADRRSMGLAPVMLDEGPAQLAAQQHAEEMAANGYLGHWGLDGSVPEQRMTRAGGEDLVLENASCFTDEQ